MKILEGKKKEFFQRIVVILSIFPNQNKNMNIIIVYFSDVLLSS